MNIEIQYDDTEVQAGFARLIQAGADMTPLMRTIANHLADVAERSFENEQEPSGTAWQQLAPTTQADKKRKGLSPKTLTRTSQLARSVLADWDNSSAVAGTNLVYAATHQFGSADDGRNIPARPIFGIGSQDEQLIQNELAQFVSKKWR